jgi:hypothetical protein
MGRTINLFMWGYQPHFRTSVQWRARRMFEILGAEDEPKVFLVGVRRPGVDEGHPVCVEPEDGEWPVSLFEGVGDEIEEAVPRHPDQQLFYTDEVTRRETPERIRREVIAEEIRRRLGPEDQRLERHTFCSDAYPVEDYHVVCVLQVPARLLRRYPPFKVAWQLGEYDTSLVHACIRALFKEAIYGLSMPDPGRMLTDDGIRSPEEIVALAASSLMRTPFIQGRLNTTDLFRDVNQLSKLLYEGRAGRGRIALAAVDDPNVEYVMRLAAPVPMSQTRWARKLLQMSSEATALVVEYDSILGLGKVSDVSAPPFSIDFLDHHQWEFRRGEQVLLRSSFGEVRLPQEPIGTERFIDNMRRIFPRIGEEAIARYRIVLDLLAQLRHGSSLVIAADAASEAQRLERQGTLIVPTPLTRQLLERATSIDGTILADPKGVCHAVGVILDGEASEESTPARGARYNSAVRYVGAGPGERMAFVISEDRTLDVIPLLRPRVSRAEIEAAVASISTATLEDYHEARTFLEKHRFYLHAAQCAVVNEALDRIENSQTEVGQIVFTTKRFEPHAAMNDGYLKGGRED